jgi:hypothetical protein
MYRNNVQKCHNQNINYMYFLRNYGVTIKRHSNYYDLSNICYILRELVQKFIKFAPNMANTQRIQTNDVATVGSRKL